MSEVKGLVQGSSQWHLWRKGKLSSSKSPIIMGISPYQTPLELFEEEIGLRDPQKSAPHMQKGLDAEDPAKEWLYKETGIKFNPACWEHDDNSLFITSLDGISEDKRSILEIKNNNMQFHEMTRTGNIPGFHICQMQKHMFVTGLGECHYLSYRDDDQILKVVKRDDSFIEFMISKELEFKAMCDDLVPPPLTDRDYVDVSDDYELQEMIRKYNRAKTESKEFEILCDIMKEKIKERAGNRNVKGNGFKLTKYVSRTIFDYDRMIADHCPNVDRNQYKKTPTFAYRITMES